MLNLKKAIPVAIFIAINLVIVGAILLIEGDSSEPKTATDENGNEYTLGVSDADTTTVLGVGDKAPDFTLATYDGKITKLSDLYKEKPVIIQFWATWCDICEREFPENNVYAQNNKDRFHFVAVNWAETTRQVQSYINRKNLDPEAITFLMNENSDVIRAYGVRGTPTHVVIGKKWRDRFLQRWLYYFRAIRPGRRLPLG